MLPLLLLALAETYGYWIQPCTPELKTACQSADTDLARWALEAWQKASRGAIRVTPASEDKARIRIYWASGNMRLYGEARPIQVEGKPGAEVYVRPDLSQLGPEIDSAGRRDPLFRHAIVYLTCLHETGHAIGLPHTARFEDIMYSFGYGGDIVEYFTRYRRLLKTREDIQAHSGISKRDEAALRQ